jgi:hypothetical protein
VGNINPTALGEKASTEFFRQPEGHIGQGSTGATLRPNSLLLVIICLHPQRFDSIGLLFRQRQPIHIRAGVAQG